MVKDVHKVVNVRGMLSLIERKLKKISVQAKENMQLVRRKTEHSNEPEIAQLRKDTFVNTESVLMLF